MSQNRLKKNYCRRDIMKWLGLGSAGVFFGHERFAFLVDNAADFASPALAADSPACVVRPAQTEGPYFVDEKLNRSDIRIDPSDNSTRPGVPLRLEFQVSRIAAGACAPLSGAIVDVWHCDAAGVYSDVRDGRFDARGKKFLRGYQQTNREGVAAFQTIYPGWYEGRAVHIHFKIRAAAAGARMHEFTSQLYFDEAVSDQVFKLSPYNGKRGRRVTNDVDFAYRQGGKELLLAPAKHAGGYAAKFDIGLQGF